MSKLFADTNIFLRYLTNDVPQQADQVEKIFKAANKGKVNIVTSVMVIAEIVWTLESYYELPKKEVQTKIMAILNTPGITVEKKALVGKAINLYIDKNIDFVDAYNSFYIKEENITQICTFDTRHFSRIEGIIALEPKDLKL